MLVKEIRRPAKDKFEFELDCKQGTISLFFAPDFVCGTWSSAYDDSFMAMNNLDNFGHGPGIEKELSIQNPGEAAEYFWEQRLKWAKEIREEKKLKEADERKEREEKRARKLAHQATLKGGLGNASGQPLFR